MGNLLKNDRLQTACSGSLFFNPYITEDNLRISQSGLYTDTGYAYYHTLLKDNAIWWDGLISDYSLISFGGQMVGFAMYKEITGADHTTIKFPSSTFNYLSNPDISSMVRLYDSVKVYTPLFDYGNSNPSGYAYAGANGTNYGTTTNTDTDNSIGSVKIMEVKMLNNTSSYGYHSLTYNSKVTYQAKLRLPYKTPIEKIQQLLQSNDILFMYDDRVVHNDYTIPSTAYNVQKPLGGGCINPVASKVSVITKSLTETYRRNTYELEVIIEG